MAECFLYMPSYRYLISVISVYRVDDNILTIRNTGRKIWQTHRIYRWRYRFREKEEICSSRMYMHDAFCSNVRTCFCNFDITDIGERKCYGICRTVFDIFSTWSFNNDTDRRKTGRLNRAKKYSCYTGNHLCCMWHSICICPFTCSTYDIKISDKSCTGSIYCCTVHYNRIDKWKEKRFQRQWGCLQHRLR